MRVRDQSFCVQLLLREWGGFEIFPNAILDSEIKCWVPSLRTLEGDVIAGWILLHIQLWEAFENVYKSKTKTNKQNFLNNLQSLEEH